MLTRFLPFLLFPNSSKTPKFIRYLGKVLPHKDGHAGCLLPAQRILYHSAFGAPEALALACVAGLHLWKKNTLLSIGAGTTLYGAHPVRLYMNRAASDAVKTAPPVLCESTPAQCKSAALPARAIAVSAHPQSARQKENRPLGKAFDRADGLKTGGNTFPHFSAPRRKVK